MTTSRFRIQYAAHVLRSGNVIAFPTETVIGLSCDPANSEALEKLINLKQRNPSKGLILIASSVRQLAEWVDFDQIENLQKVLDSWPGPETWIVPAKQHVSSLITGENWIDKDHLSLAVRVTDNPTIVKICDAFEGALISTSANISGQGVARSMIHCRKIFNSELGYYLNSDDKRSHKPSRIRHAMTGELIRG